MSKILSAEALKEYADFDEVLRRYPVGRSTIIRAVNAGGFPAPSLVNGKTRWRKADLDAHDTRNSQ
ncbi:helix-turn-helix domain-containing protein [Bradyrhizobium sp. CCGUVB1N3]|uniref:helix-turn-helix transcriptional regulator n=1 Tax=Bradyrhizobium sp. CCGUVB1N3 TaxID=2949629 RepID=UPI0020B39AF6|nr:helix-turn-helix domain-containing protein [Bradyrhizobium sp. CCGUVB1N3]MCP3475611.1 helix-turn-helix domain-containing protein [Bradyrhizobium sp. CCGUVB1N3]